MEEMWPAILPMIKFSPGVTLSTVIQTVLKLVTLAPTACCLEPGTVPGPLQTLFLLFIAFHPHGHDNFKAVFLKVCSSDQLC